MNEEKLNKQAHAFAVENDWDLSIKEAFIQGAKWQEQQVIDVEELRKEFLRVFENVHPLDVDMEHYWLFFLPHLKQSDEWISVDDRLPEIDEGNQFMSADVLCLKMDGNYTITYYNHKQKMWLLKYDNDKITHWQPLPTAPKK